MQIWANCIQFWQYYTAIERMLSETTYALSVQRAFLWRSIELWHDNLLNITLWIKKIFCLVSGAKTFFLQITLKTLLFLGQ